MKRYAHIYLKYKLNENPNDWLSLISRFLPSSLKKHPYNETSQKKTQTRSRITLRTFCGVSNWFWVKLKSHHLQPQSKAPGRCDGSDLTSPQISILSKCVSQQGDFHLSSLIGFQPTWNNAWLCARYVAVSCKCRDMS